MSYPRFSRWCSRWCADFSLLFGEGDELAVEIGDVGHDTALDRVGGGRETPEYVSDYTLGRSRWTLFFRLGCLRVWRVRRLRGGVKHEEVRHPEEPIIMQAAR